MAFCLPASRSGKSELALELIIRGSGPGGRRRVELIDAPESLKGAPLAAETFSSRGLGMLNIRRSWRTLALNQTSTHQRLKRPLSGILPG